jgi:hypothetical protein
MGGVGVAEGGGERVGSVSGGKFSFWLALLLGWAPPSVPSFIALPVANDPGFIQTTFSSFLRVGRIAKTKTAAKASR